MKRLILCDFDGTISLRDMGYDLLNRFSSGDWETIDRDFSEGKIGSKEAYSRIAKIIRWDREAVYSFIQEHSDIDPYFSLFYRYCTEQGIDIKIVSDGLDLYIRRVLDSHRLNDIPAYSNCGHFLNDRRVDVSFPHFNEECGLCGTCKKKLLQAHRKFYDAIFFVGNGLSDRCASREADFVFAKSSLYTFCIDQGIVCHHFHDFREILGDLKKQIRGIIFDLDGTLIEAYEAIYIALKEVFRRFGKEIFPPEELKHYLRPDLEATLSQFFLPGTLPEAISIMRRAYEEVYLQETRFLDGARETLDAFRSRGVLMGVASNKFGRFSRGALKHLGVSDYFHSVIGAGDVPRNKPFPDMIHAVLREIGLPPEEVVFVGDTLTDIETGRQAGVDVYALPTGFHNQKELSQGRPRRILKDLKELISLQEGSLPPFS